MDTTEDPRQTGEHIEKKHPPGLYLLFITEMWERYSYYGMRVLLVLYLTAAFISGGLGFEPGTAMLIYGFYTGLVYFTPLIGGWLSDRFIGLRKAITIGGITMALGDFTIFAFQSRWGLFLGLGLLIIGNGFFKPNISTLVGELYGPGDKRRDSAFTIFYMGINIGALLSMVIAGYLAEDLFKTMNDGVVHYGFKWAFLASSIGMIIGQLTFNLLGPRYLGKLGTKPKGKPDKGKEKDKTPLTKKEKQRVTVLLILACFVIFFWAGFEQAGTSFTLYTKHFVDREIAGYVVPVAWVQLFNPLFIIILAPVISAMWLRLAKSKRGDLNIPTKMALGMILLGLGFMVLVPAVLQTGSNEENIVAKVSILVIMVTYLFHTLGELFLSPIGLSLVSKIAPVKLASLLMGVWLAATGVANFLAGLLASTTASFGYLELFSAIGALAIFFGLVLLALSKKLTKMMT